jgi:AmiR/NasT family two-component response regulator
MTKGTRYEGDSRRSHVLIVSVDRLRVLIANEHIERLGLLAGVVEGLGHDVVARSTSVTEVAATTARERPDVAIVGLGDSSEHALELVSEIVREAYCPVIALLSEYDAEWVSEAAKRGVFAYIVEAHPDELQSAMDITLRRFAEVRSLQGAVERRNAEASEALAAASARQRQALELHDGVVQGLVTAQLAHDLGRDEESRKALVATLERAKAIVSRSLAELEAKGHNARELIKEAAAGPADG